MGLILALVPLVNAPHFLPLETILPGVMQFVIGDDCGKLITQKIPMIPPAARVHGIFLRCPRRSGGVRENALDNRHQSPVLTK